MLAWLSANWGNIVILGVIALVLVAIVISRIRAKRAGKGTCSCGCGGCAMQGVCHAPKEQQKPQNNAEK